MKSARAHSGFTMIELIVIIMILGILAVSATSYFLDFRNDARKAAATNFINYLQSSLKTKQVQLALHCGATSQWPRLESIKLNDITENGNPAATCKPEQIPNPEERKFLGAGKSPLEVPVNPFNNLATFEVCNCTNVCDPTCYSTVGFCYNPSTGVIWGQGLLNNCP